MIPVRCMLRPLCFALLAFVATLLAHAFHLTPAADAPRDARSRWAAADDARGAILVEHDARRDSELLRPTAPRAAVLASTELPPLARWAMFISPRAAAAPGQRSLLFLHCQLTV